MRPSFPFVARQTELYRLQEFLDSALAGQGQVCLVTGEAGSGKTTLTTEFARRALETHADLVVAIGQCDAQTGQGTPYLPFREVLDLLTGNVDAEQAAGVITQENARRLRDLLQTSGEVLLEVAPDLIGLFVPWAGLLMRLGSLAAEKGGLAEKIQRLKRQRPEGQQESQAPGGPGLDQTQIFEQYISVLGALASTQALMLVLDDLQWADASSIELLFRLGRRLAGHRILLVGTYRPEEVALGRSGCRHPLEKVLAEFKRYHGDIHVDLDKAQEAAGRQFVDELLDSQPNLLDEPFRQALFQHTSGNPLFSVELLRAMQERDSIVKDGQGRWIEGPALEWTTLPARVEGVIEERIGRLEEELRETITLASVEGRDFTAEILARLRQMDARHLIHRLSSELEKQHRLIVAHGLQRVGAQRMSRYRFAHDLLHNYLYMSLDEAEKAYLHEDVGRALEEMYGSEVKEIAVQLARHFSAAGIPEKAQRYLRLAGEQAAAQFANHEAIDFLQQALELTPQDDLLEQYEILLTREAVLNLQGARRAQASDLTHLENLVSEARDVQKQATVALRRAQYAEAVSDYTGAMRAAETAIRLAQSIGDASLEAIGYLHWGRALLHEGDYEPSYDHLVQALHLARSEGLRSVEASCLNNLGLLSWYQGEFQEGRRHLVAALNIRRELEEKLGQGHVLTNLAGVAYEQGNHTAAVSFQEQALDTYRRTGYRRGEGLALTNLGMFAADRGDYPSAGRHLSEALSLYRSVGDQEGEVTALINSGILLSYQGRYQHGKTRIEEALSISRSTGDRRGEVEALVYLSLILSKLADNETARQQALDAIAITEVTHDRRNKSHALTHLGHALEGLGQLQEATAAYRQALELRQTSGEHHRATETLAGLARVDLALNEPAEALHHVEEILSFLEAHTLDGTDEPFRVFLTCYRVLSANEDPRASDILTSAHQLLQERAALIEDEELRRSFLENVPAHRELRRTAEAQDLLP